MVSLTVLKVIMLAVYLIIGSFLFYLGAVGFIKSTKFVIALFGLTVVFSIAIALINREINKRKKPPPSELQNY